MLVSFSGKKQKDFLQRAFTVIFWCNDRDLVLETCSHFNGRIQEQTTLAIVIGLIAPVFAPLGFRENLADYRQLLML